MARLYFLIVCLLAAPTAAALEKEPLERYQARRAALSSKLNDGITVVFAYEEPEGPSATLGFRQNENFYYLTGIAEPGGILVLVPRLTDRSSPHSGKAEKFPREILFLPPRDPKQERWTGPKLGPRDPDVRQRTGFQTVLSQKFFEQELLRLLPAYGVLYTVLPSGHNRGNRSFEHDRSNRLKTLAPFAKIRDAGPEIARLRQVKSKSELALLEKAIDASMEAHREAMQAVRSGIYEYEIAALMKYVFERLGCERPAFAPIVGSGSTPPYCTTTPTRGACRPATWWFWTWVASMAATRLISHAHCRSRASSPGGSARFMKSCSARRRRLSPPSSRV